MGTTKQASQMDTFFRVDDKRYQTSIYMNTQLWSMSKKEMSNVIDKFGLSPVWKYLDPRTINGEEGNRNIRGFARYMDNYFLEMSGGSRTTLTRLGRAATNKYPTAFSLRLMRLEIITSILTNMQDARDVPVFDSHTRIENPRG